jgi:hypothetical protein
MLNQKSFFINQKNLRDQQFFQKRKPFPIIIITAILLLICYILWQKTEQVKNKVDLSSKNEAEKTNEQKINQAEVAKTQFLQIKDDTIKIANINDALAISQKYFTTDLQTKVKQNLTNNLSEGEKLNLFWQAIEGNVSLIEDIIEITATTIDETHVKLAIETKNAIFELTLIWENDNWRYDGEEKIIYIKDETGKLYKVVTKEEAEYEIINNEYGQKISQLKDGQAILSDESEASTSSAITN